MAWGLASWTLILRQPSVWSHLRSPVCSACLVPVVERLPVVSGPILCRRCQVPFQQMGKGDIGSFPWGRWGPGRSIKWRLDSSIDTMDPIGQLIGLGDLKHSLISKNLLWFRDAYWTSIPWQKLSGGVFASSSAISMCGQPWLGGVSWCHLVLLFWNCTFYGTKLKTPTVHPPPPILWPHFLLFWYWTNFFLASGPLHWQSSLPRGVLLKLFMQI